MTINLTVVALFLVWGRHRMGSGGRELSQPPLFLTCCCLLSSLSGIHGLECKPRGLTAEWFFTPVSPTCFSLFFPFTQSFHCQSHHLILPEVHIVLYLFLTFRSFLRRNVCLCVSTFQVYCYFVPFCCAILNVYTLYQCFCWLDWILMEEIMPKERLLGVFRCGLSPVV